MAYMNQERKKAFAVELKKALKGTGIKYTLGVHHHSTIRMTIQSGPIDFFTNYYETVKDKGQYRETVRMPEKHMQINDFWYQEHFTGKALDVLKKIITILNTGNYNRSDIQSDYFDVGWYLSVNIGKWDKPYQLVK